MLTADSLLQLLLHRADSLVPMLAIAFLVGDVVAHYSGIDWLIERIDRIGAYLARKLDRPNRSIATRVYRGIIAVTFLLIPAIVLGLVLTQPTPAARAIGVILIIALIGRGFASLHLWRSWRAAHLQKLTLELPKRDYLFADSHAVLRYLLLRSGMQFATGVIGASFWYLIGGLPLMLPYLLLAELTVQFHTKLFGWATQALFTLVDAIPRLLSWVLLILAALFVPNAHPLAARHARSFHGLLSNLLGISLGGTLPDRELPWAGTGTPKLLPSHLLRWMLVRLVATVLLLFALAAPNIYKLLIPII